MTGTWLCCGCCAGAGACAGASAGAGVGAGTPPLLSCASSRRRRGAGRPTPDRASLPRRLLWGGGDGSCGSSTSCKGESGERHVGRLSPAICMHSRPHSIPAATRRSAGAWAVVHTAPTPPRRSAAGRPPYAMLAAPRPPPLLTSSSDSASSPWPPEGPARSASTSRRRGAPRATPGWPVPPPRRLRRVCMAQLCARALRGGRFRAPHFPPPPPPANHAAAFQPL